MLPDRGYITGIELIDQQHTELFNRIDQLTSALYRGEGKKALGNLIGFLETYVIEHFQTEEDLMFKCGYVEIGEHIKEHRAFRELFQSVKKEIMLRGSDNYLAIRMEKEVRRWWQDHILKMDHKYVTCLKDN